MKISMRMLILAGFISAFAFACTSTETDAGWSNSIEPVNGQLQLPISAVSDGKAHHYKTKASDGTIVHFFVLKSQDGVIRAAIDACDVCYKAGKGYYQDGDFMVCQNCGQRFASSRINEIKGGCNPAPLRRTVQGDNLLIAMNDIDANKWYMKYRR